MKCPNCGKEHNFNFCPDCGTARPSEVVIHPEIITTITRTFEWYANDSIPVVASISYTPSKSDSEKSQKYSVQSLTVGGEETTGAEFVSSDDFEIHFFRNDGIKQGLILPDKVIDALRSTEDAPKKFNPVRKSLEFHRFQQSNPVDFAQSDELPAVQESIPSPAKRVVCPECGCSNITYQFVADSSKIRTRNTGCLWGIARFFLIFFTCGLWLLIGKRSGSGKIKNKNIKVAICQNCGHSWNC